MGNKYQARYDRRVAAGLCGRCGKEKPPGTEGNCPACVSMVRQYMAAKRADDKRRKEESAKRKERRRKQKLREAEGKKQKKKAKAK